MIDYYVIVVNDVGCDPADWYKALDKINDLVVSVKEYMSLVAATKTLSVMRFSGRNIDDLVLEEKFREIQAQHMINITLFEISKSWTWRKNESPS